jgi:hypothetical protein
VYSYNTDDNSHRENNVGTITGLLVFRNLDVYTGYVLSRSKQGEKEVVVVPEFLS